MNNNDDFLRRLRDSEMNNGKNIDPESIMSEQEINDFGIEIVTGYAKRNGYEIIDATTVFDKYPQLALCKNEQIYWERHRSDRNSR